MEMLKLHSVDTAVDTEGNTYEMERIGNSWVNKYAIPDYDLEHTVVEWYDELGNFDLMRLTMWCIEHKISTPYTFR
jgi:hypothetical protein